jgi:Zn-dependent membrane protease YugP
MPLLLLPILVLITLFGPSIWVQWVMRRHAKDLPGCRWTGAELAEHLLVRKNIEAVTVLLTTDHGDHYDLTHRTVNLTHDVFHGRSLTALTVAAHEVGHAIQHAEHHKGLARRNRLVARAQNFERLLPWIIGGLTVSALVIRIPAFFLLVFVLIAFSLGLRTLAHLVTLPVEWDASFARAMPMLEHTGVIHPKDTQAARRILTAAALTNVSASLATALKIGRWLRLLRA